ncbi:MAG: hypothetical protein JWM80_3040 [Cyanobacteria bacterium RYN_339]|nr:hypothetical protein [Cyanobacteria bacterium RYN_339]
MANDVATNDPLAWLVQALEPELAKVEASSEYNYSSSERGSLTINRAGKAMQTSYFASFELQALRDGGPAALEKQKLALIAQIERLLNPPKPSPISLAGMMPARRGRTAAKKPAAAGAVEAEPEAAQEGGDAGGDAEPAEAAEPAENAEE